MKTKPIIAALIAAFMVAECPVPVQAVKEPKADVEVQTDYTQKAGRAMKAKWKHGKGKGKVRRATWHRRLRIEWRK